MNRKEAKHCLKLGNKLIHRHFSDDEWVQKSKDYIGKYEFEDGNVCTPDDFWNHRNSDSFDKDWSVKAEFPKGHNFILRHKPSIWSEDIIDEEVRILAIDQRGTHNVYFLSNGMAFHFWQMEGKIKDGVFSFIRDPLSDNDLR